MKKLCMVLAVLIGIAWVGTVFAAETYAPGVRDTGSIGTVNRPWGEGYFRTLSGQMRIRLFDGSNNVVTAVMANPYTRISMDKVGDASFTLSFTPTDASTNGISMTQFMICNDASPYGTLDVSPNTTSYTFDKLGTNKRVLIKPSNTSSPQGPPCATFVYTRKNFISVTPNSYATVSAH